MFVVALGYSFRCVHEVLLFCSLLGLLALKVLTNVQQTLRVSFQRNLHKHEVPSGSPPWKYWSVG